MQHRNSFQNQNINMGYYDSPCMYIIFMMPVQIGWQDEDDSKLAKPKKWQTAYRESKNIHKVKKKNC